MNTVQRPLHSAIPNVIPGQVATPYFGEFPGRDATDAHMLQALPQCRPSDEEDVYEPELWQVLWTGEWWSDCDGTRECRPLVMEYRAEPGKYWPALEVSWGGGDCGTDSWGETCSSLIGARHASIALQQHWLMQDAESDGPEICV